MSYLLIIDTAHQQARVALARDGEVLAQREWENGKQVGIDLLKQIDEVLDEVGIALGDVTRIGVHVGPGGYSSLRAGIVTAQMLVLAHDIELVQVTQEGVSQMVSEAAQANIVEKIAPTYKT